MFCLRWQVLDILQHIQALDPSQHGAVGYLVQHTLEHIQHKKHPAAPEVKLRSATEHLEVRYSVGLIMKHKRLVVFRVLEESVDTSNLTCTLTFISSHQVWI